MRRTFVLGAAAILASVAAFPSMTLAAGCAQYDPNCATYPLPKNEAAGKTGSVRLVEELLDLEMLVLTPRGRERTREEFQGLLKQSGFRLRRVVPTETHLSVVEGVRA